MFYKADLQVIKYNTPSRPMMSGLSWTQNNHVTVHIYLFKVKYLKIMCRKYYDFFFQAIRTKEKFSENIHKKAKLGYCPLIFTLSA